MEWRDGLWLGRSCTIIKKNCHDFKGKLLEVVDCSLSDESKNLITRECMERFENIIGELADIIQEGEYYQDEGLTNDYQNAKKLNSWILLGSLTETILQMFLAFYIDDYKNSKWQQWEDFKVDQVQDSINNVIQQLVQAGSLEPKQARSIKNAIKETIQRHTKEHHVEKIMLEELIQLFSVLNLLDEEELDYLRTIRDNRNGVHSFQSRTIGTWDNLQYSVRFFCYLMEWVVSHLPDVPDEEYY